MSLIGIRNSQTARTTIATAGATEAARAHGGNKASWLSLVSRQAVKFETGQKQKLGASGAQLVSGHSIAVITRIGRYSTKITRPCRLQGRKRDPHSDQSVQNVRSGDARDQEGNTCD